MPTSITTEVASPVRAQAARYHAVTFARVDNEDGVDSDEEAARAGCGVGLLGGALSSAGSVGNTCEDVRLRRSDAALCSAVATNLLPAADALVARLWNLFTAAAPPRVGGDGLLESLLMFCVGPGARILAGAANGDAALARFTLLLVENGSITMAQAAAALAVARATAASEGGGGGGGGGGRGAGGGAQ